MAVKFYTIAGGKEEFMRKKMTWQEWLEDGSPSLENNDGICAVCDGTGCCPYTSLDRPSACSACGGTGSGPEEKEDD